MGFNGHKMLGTAGPQKVRNKKILWDVVLKVFRSTYWGKLMSEMDASFDNPGGFNLMREMMSTFLEKGVMSYSTEVTNET